MFFPRGASSLSDNNSDFDEVDSVPTLQSDRSSSQTTSIGGTSLNAVLQNLASRDDLQFGSSEDEDNFNGQLQKRNLFQSLQHNHSYLSPGRSSLSVNSDTSTSSQAQSVSGKLNTRKRRPISSNNSTYSNHSDSSQQNPFMAEILPPDLKRDESAKISALLRRKNAVKVKGIHHDTRNDFGHPVTRPESPVDLLSVPSSKRTNGNDFSSTHQAREIPGFLSNSSSDSVQIPYPVDHFSSISVSHHSYGVPMIQPSVTQTFRSLDDSVINSDNDQQYSSETNNHPGSTPITQSPPLTSTSPNVETPPLNSTTTDSNPISPKDNSPVTNIEAGRKPNTISFFFNLVTPHEKVQPPQTQQWRPPLRFLQRTSDSGYSSPSDDFTPAPDGVLPVAWNMEELGRLRMESRNLVAQTRTGFETPSSRSTAIPKADLQPQPQTLQECNSSDVATFLKQQALQTQLDKGLAELRGVEAENKRLTNENESQQRSISQLNITLDEQNKSLIQISNQLHVATSSLTLLNKEKTEWQDKLDSMLHKLNAAERQVRCLDHLTRQKLESRQEAVYGQPKRRGPLPSIPASTDVIGEMRALNEEIYQTCVQLTEGLERTAVFSNKQKPQVQKMLGDHLTVMMEDQAKKATSGYNMLLMQTVLEVFMTHWCSSIIEAFYPKQESFSDLLVRLSALTTNTSELPAICGKKIKIIQSSTHNDSVKFNEWVKDIVDELGLVLTMAGLRMKPQCASLFSTKTLALVKAAYDLRTAMAEKDICGGLEIVLTPPDTPFQEKWMMDAHANPRKVVDTDHQSQVDFVAGTTGIGLQRKVSERVDGQFQSTMEVELKPKVTLTWALKVKN